MVGVRGPQGFFAFEGFERGEPFGAFEDLPRANLRASGCGHGVPPTGNVAAGGALAGFNDEL